MPNTAQEFVRDLFKDSSASALSAQEAYMYLQSSKSRIRLPLAIIFLNAFSDMKTVNKMYSRMEI